jgi:transcription elongation factor SPT6
MIKTGEGRNGEKVQGDDNFSVILKCKPQDIKRHDNYINQMDMDINQIPEEDLENYAYKVQEEQTQHQKKAQIQKRKIQHQRFQNITSTLAVQYLQKEDNGEFYFRPSSRGTDHLTLTWKFFENNIVHIDI